MKLGMVESPLYGYLTYSLVPNEQCSKLDNKAIKCIFVGYSLESKGYRLYHKVDFDE